jgi:hypothetical protein
MMRDTYFSTLFFHGVYPLVEIIFPQAWRDNAILQNFQGIFQTTKSVVGHPSKYLAMAHTVHG